jgi:hypothetical protein
MSALVILATYEQSKTAYFLKEKLKAENINCFLSPNLLSSLSGYKQSPMHLLLRLLV